MSAAREQAEGEAVDRLMMAGVYRFAFRFLHNHDDALDATQDVLLKWLRRGNPQVQSRAAWLRRVTANHCIDLIRRRRPIAHPVLEPAAIDGPGNAEELCRDVAEALGRLSDAQRAVVVAKVYEQETFAAIAGQLGVSISTVKTHYVRGLESLRAALATHRQE